MQFKLLPNYCALRWICGNVGSDFSFGFAFKPLPVPKIVDLHVDLPGKTPQFLLCWCGSSFLVPNVPYDRQARLERLALCWLNTLDELRERFGGVHPICIQHLG